MWGKNHCALLIKCKLGKPPDMLKPVWEFFNDLRIKLLCNLCYTVPENISKGISQTTIDTPVHSCYN